MGLDAYLVFSQIRKCQKGLLAGCVSAQKRVQRAHHSVLSC
jgi:hypothetical protein